MKSFVLLLFVFISVVIPFINAASPQSATQPSDTIIYVEKTLDSNLTILYTIRIDTLRVDTIDNRKPVLPQGYVYTADSLVAYAKTLIGTPYKYSARGPSAFDCSGFTKYVFAKFGYTLENSSRYQYRSKQWRDVSRDSLNIGDLVFFGSRSSSSSVGHVGIVVSVDENSGDFSFIHASTTIGVCINDFNSSPYYVNRYIGAKRVLPEYDTLNTGLTDVVERNNETTLDTDGKNDRIQYYTVKMGDNLWRIAKNHGLTLRRLCRLNDIHDAADYKLMPGDKLRIK